MFDLDRLEQAAARAIAEFAATHPDVLFDAFALDADLLCLSRLEDIDAARANLEREGPLSAERLDALRRETGDFRHQGFAEMTEEDGFDPDAYREHYKLDDAGQRTSAYALAMDELLRRLVARGAFDGLRRTDDFLVIRVEHGY